ASSYIQSALGLSEGEESGEMTVLTANGEETANGDVHVLTSIETVSDNLYKTTVEKKRYDASSSANFVFVGKGYGHGVGISQYGAKCLGDFGYSCEEILKMYFSGIEMTRRSDLG
ncbi:MAG: hypothetical protein II797_03040, partial [Clostridia bacterium]|nr:hypothetical protein [Clostridia bacterium]